MQLEDAFREVIYREYRIWNVSSSIHSHGVQVVEQREATRTSIFFLCHMPSMRWTALLCHHGLKSLKPSVNRNLPFLNLSPWVFIKVKKNLTTIWSPFWKVLKEVLETSVWSLSLKKCAGLCSLVLWLPGERWDFFFSSQTHASHWHLWQDTIDRALTATEWMRSLPPPLNL